ncbi:unnamed protein product [Durusdinium trenchii]|uniref:Uncharacterized protein n=1 Tax=Durusdinium trenchii TaxID=1381693 RepID=A0ABP0PY29_9DINO
MGKKDGFANPLTKQLHDISTAMIPRTKLAIHENVTEYAEDEYLKEETGFIVQKTELSPRLFGEPTNRNRAWRILFDPEKVFWNCIYTFKELTEIFLVPHGSPLRVSPLIFLTATEKEIKVHSKMLEDLSPSEAYHLNKFMEQRPSKGFYDLSSNPDHRRRTETSDGALMTLTTNTHIWSCEKERMLTAKEMLATLGYPCRATMANQLQTDARLDFTQRILSSNFIFP